jgi:hypothetical protein
MTGFATKEVLALIRAAVNCGLADVRSEIAGVRHELGGAKSELELKMAGMKGDLEVKIADVKSDVLRWMFAFFITTLLAILGLYFKK